MSKIHAVHILQRLVHILFMVFYQAHGEKHDGAFVFYMATLSDDMFINAFATHSSTATKAIDVFGFDDVFR